MTRPHDPTSADDPTIVPGFAPDVPLPRTEGGALDPAYDPDRYDAAVHQRLDPDPYDPRLDPALDPDRYDPSLDPAASRNPDGRTLPEMLGPGAFEEPRDTWAWAMGLVGVLLFLALASWIFGSIVRY